ncbi:hypothetical protein IBX65_09205 [Candidatus Aerophobetes bacterium]|nr:hypothetical protein [Candidatus Aerophobetes bacterium]
MKNWLMAIGGGAIIVVAIWLIVIFAPQVLVFLKGIVGIAAGIAGGALLAIGAGGVKTALTEKRANKEKKAEPARADSQK